MPTSTLRSHNPTTSVSRGATRCRIGLSETISLLAVALCFCALRPGWCQTWCQTVSPVTTVVRLVAPRTSSGAATLFSIESAPRDYPRASPRQKTLYSTLPQAVHTLLFGARPKSSEPGRKRPLRALVNNPDCECSSTFHLGSRVRAGWQWNPPRRPTPPSSLSRA